MLLLLPSIKYDELLFYLFQLLLLSVLPTTMLQLITLAVLTANSRALI